MFDSARSSAAGDSGADYGHVRPLAPGAVDPVRLAALVEGVDAGALVWDPAEEALFGPDPDIDVAALFAAVDDADSDLTEISGRRTAEVRRSGGPVGVGASAHAVGRGDAAQP